MATKLTAREREGIDTQTEARALRAEFDALRQELPCKGSRPEAKDENPRPVVVELDD